MLETAKEAARAAGAVIRESTPRTIEHKGCIDLVTDVDRRSQELIVRLIGDAFPGHDVIAEEGHERRDGNEFCWIIDPLDGTTNFVHGIPFYCVSIACWRNGSPFIGVCYDPVHDELYHAQKDEGAYLNGERIRVSEADLLVDAIVATGFPYDVHDGSREVVERLSRVLERVQGIRRFGAAALDLCHVARGVFDGFYETSLKAWDMAAGALIVQEAGGKISLFDGSPFEPFDGEILATNGRIHEQLESLL